MQSTESIASWKDRPSSVWFWDSRTWWNKYSLQTRIAGGILFEIVELNVFSHMSDLLGSNARNKVNIYIFHYFTQIERVEIGKYMKKSNLYL